MDWFDREGLRKMQKWLKMAKSDQRKWLISISRLKVITCMKLRCRIFCLGECAKSIVSPAVLWGAMLICFDVHKEDFDWGLYDVDLEYSN